MSDDVKQLSIESFQYDLPEERIAKFPLEQRDHSKLLIWKNGEIEETVFFQLHHHIPASSMLVFNNTRVIHARLIFYKQTGAKIEIFCLEPFPATDYATAFAARKKVTWKCLVGNAKRWKDEPLTKELHIQDSVIHFKAEKTEQTGEEFTVTFSWDNDGFTFSELIEAAGLLPIPPYLNREAVSDDETTYQTVYAKHEGSVAAPTAGLHFTNAVFQTLKQKQISDHYVTLHVGAGTFKPVKSETLEQHGMHHEHMVITKQLLEEIKEQLDSGKPLIAVGTTSLRVLESLYWFGVKLTHQPQLAYVYISQWEPYELTGSLSASEAIEQILQMLNKNHMEELRGETGILIAPGYAIKIADALITNFHQPKSTLLLLVSALTGNRWKEIYDYAIKNEFRFLSYGDSSLLWKS